MENQTIAVLLAIYEPREDWLIELLDSLNAQTYPQLKLYVRDDASPSYPFSRLEELLREHVTRFPYHAVKSEKNGGSNQAFAKLVEDAKDEDYIAFCDQDDVWLPEKIEKTVKLYEESPLHPTLVCTNVSVMDGDGNEISPSLDQHRKRHVFLRGEGLAPQLIYRNFVTGCTVLMERERALSYLPFPSSSVHDHYLAFRAALDGAIDYLEEPQMRYRVYGGNQTGVMAGVQTKEDYLNKRILQFSDRVTDFCRYSSDPSLALARQWCDARLKNFHREKGGFSALWKLRGVNRVTSLFELFGLRFPKPLFRFAVKQITKGRL